MLPIFRGLAPPYLGGLRPDKERSIIDYIEDASEGVLNIGAIHRSNDDAGIAIEAAVYAAGAYSASAVAMDDTAASEGAADAVFLASSIDDHEIHADILALGAGVRHEALLRRPLWEQEVPKLFLDSWRDLKETLISLDSNWSVWTEWYEDRLFGLTNKRSRQFIADLEVDRICISDQDWANGPKHVNALIADIEAKYRVQVPEQMPASQAFELGEDGILHRSFGVSPAARTAAQEKRLRDAWKAHEDILKSVEILNPGRNSTALESALKAYRRAMGDTYEELNVIALGVHGTRISAVAERADSILMEDAAAEVVALAASHGMFMPQFDAWNEWRADAREQFPEDAVNSAARVALNIAHADDLADDEVKTDLTDVAVAASAGSILDLRADPAERRPPPEIEKDLILVVSNALSTLFKEPVKCARDGSLQGVELVFKISVTLLMLGGLKELATALPAEYGWVQFALKMLDSAAKAASGG